MVSARLGSWILGILIAVGAVVGLASSGWLTERTATMLDDASQLVGGTGAAVLCWWMSRRLDGPERRWRRLMAPGMAGWSIGMALWAWYRSFSDTPLPSPSLADLGFFTLPVFALPALLVFAVDPPRMPAFTARRAPLVMALDSLVVVGSLFLITWVTSLGAVVRAGAPTTSEFLVAIGYPITDLVLVMIVLLLVLTGCVPARYRGQLGLLGGGLVMIALSDSLFAYLVSSGAEEMPLAMDAGFIAGPAFIALAAVTTSSAETTTRPSKDTVALERTQLLVPHILAVVTGSVVTAQVVVGQELDTVEIVALWTVVGLVLLRQVVTMLENLTLLRQLSGAKEELAHRADHDPLTGLANRSLFNERLEAALERHDGEGQSLVLLVVDLDDFKAVNDSYGHGTGDQLLLAVGERLRANVRETDTVARMGGDEFAVVLAGSDEPPRAIGERILRAVREPYELDGHLLTFSASIGVIEPPFDADLTPDNVLRLADSAMYQGKRSGKDVVVEYGPHVLPPGALTQVKQSDLPPKMRL